MKEAIRERAKELGFNDCRFTTAETPASGSKLQQWLGEGMHGEMGYLERNAPKRLDPQQVLPGAKSIITLAVSYARGDTHSEAGAEGCRGGGSRSTAPSGFVARYARYDDYHKVIGERLKSLTQFVDHVSGATARSLWYIDTGPILERDLAQRSGIGFIGKHTNLISRKMGNWLFLSEILTTVDLKPDAPEKNRCGSCSCCMTACPTAAIKAPFQLDARRCISYLTIELKGAIPIELRPAVGNRIFGCDDCLAVCPWNRFAGEAHMMKEHQRSDLDTPDLMALLDLDDAGFKRRFAGSPIYRLKRKGLLRNVYVALGNVADESILPALEKAAGNLDPVLSEHAGWAINQIRERNKKAAPP